MVSGDPQNTKPIPVGKKAKKLSQKEQSAQFVETARELSSDESGESFERAIDAMLVKQTID